MVDSAIGGKTGVDLPEGKNYVGAIWQPDLVVMDTDLLATLPPRELSCGFAEVVKYGLLSGADFAARVQEWPTLPGPDRTSSPPSSAPASTTSSPWWPRTSATGASARRSTSATRSATASRPRPATTATATARPSRWACWRRCACRRRPWASTRSWRERTAAVLARHDLPTRLEPEVTTPEILDAMGRDKKADATALNMVMIAAPGDVRLRVSPPHDRLVAAIEELRR